MEIKRGVQMDIIGKIKSALGGKSAGMQARAAEVSDSEIAARIRATEMFQRLPDDAIAAVVQNMKKVPVRKGEVVVQEGAEGDYYYVLLSGTANVARQDRGRTQVLAELKPGAAFGEEALISNAKRNASIAMLTDGVVLRLSKEDFNERVKETLVTWLSPAEAQKKVTDGARWLDARDESDAGVQRLHGAVVCPLGKLRESLPILKKEEFYVCYCQNGRQSSTAAFLLAQRGFNVAVMRGGLQGLQRAGLL